MQTLANGIDRVNLATGHFIAWTVVAMALVQFAVVIMRYVFAYGSIAMQESVWYMHGITFMIGAGYTLLKDAHVRVDVFYREASNRKRAMTDLVGAVLLVIPFCVCVFVTSWGLVIHSWEVLETSPDFGLPFVYLLKTVIWIFSVLVGMQGLSMATRAWGYLRGHTDNYGLISESRDDGDA